MTGIEKFLTISGLVMVGFIIVSSNLPAPKKHLVDPYQYLAQFKKQNPRFPIDIGRLDNRTAMRTQKLLWNMPPDLRRGVTIWAGYRSDDLQAQIIRAAYGETHPHLKGPALERAVLRGYSHPRNGKAAAPGFSRHRLGHAIDIRGSRAAMAWLHKNAPRFGLINPPSIRRRDPWHFELK